MKKYTFTIQGNKYDVRVKDIEENLAEVEVNGTKYKVEVDKQIKQTKTPVLVRSVVSPSTDSEKATAKTARPGFEKGAGFIKSPLPGTIIDVHVKVGDLVKTGTRLITLEAMKMENNINSDREGKVVSLKVQRGDSVMEGDTLVEIGVAQ